MTPYRIAGPPSVGDQVAFTDWLGVVWDADVVGLIYQDPNYHAAAHRAAAIVQPTVGGVPQNWTVTVNWTGP